MNPMLDLHLLLIDDHAMFRAGLSQLIHMSLPHARVSQAASVGQGVALDDDRIQVVLLDVKLNGASGLEGIASVKRRWPKAVVVMLSSQDAPETRRLALARGAAAFVSKAETAEAIVSVLEQVCAGEISTSDQARTGGGAKSAMSKKPAKERLLTPRQREVLTLLHEGLPNKLIARRLDLSDNTVRRHLQDIFEYFGVDSRAEALIAARHHALVD